MTDILRLSVLQEGTIGVSFKSLCFQKVLSSGMFYCQKLKLISTESEKFA